LHILLKHYKPATRVASSKQFSGAGIIRVAVADVGAEQQARVCSNAQYTVAERSIPTNLPSRETEKVNISQIDLAALENMPLNQLQQPRRPTADLHKNFHFISDQEERTKTPATDD